MLVLARSFFRGRVGASTKDHGAEALKDAGAAVPEVLSFAKSPHGMRDTLTPIPRIRCLLFLFALLQITVMAVFFVGHIHFYGQSQYLFGDLGPVVAWPLIMSSTVRSPGGD